MTVRIVPNVVPAAQRRAVLRLLHLDTLQRGLDPAEWQRWRGVACPYPHLRDTPEVAAVRRCLDEVLRPWGQPCEPQFVAHWPDAAERWDSPPHIDEPPPWADGRPYTLIAGLALTSWTEQNGSLRYWTRQGDVVPVELRAGSVVLVPPALPHATGLNRTGLPRFGLYLRWVEPARAAGAA